MIQRAKCIVIKSVAAVLLSSLLSYAQTLTHSVTLTWTDPNNPTGTQYNIYRATGQCSGNPAFTKIAGPIAGLTTNDTSVTIGPYCYYVTATNGTVESAPSPTAGVTVTPFAPSSLTLVAK